MCDVVPLLPLGVIGVAELGQDGVDDARTQRLQGTDAEHVVLTHHVLDSRVVVDGTCCLDLGLVFVVGVDQSAIGQDVVGVGVPAVVVKLPAGELLAADGDHPVVLAVSLQLTEVGPDVAHNQAGGFDVDFHEAVVRLRKSRELSRLLGSLRLEVVLDVVHLGALPLDATVEIVSTI
jgi:hypothetical protein